MLSKLRRWLREGAILLVLLAGVIILLDVWRSPQMPAMFDSTPLHTLDGETVTLASISEERRCCSTSGRAGAVSAVSPRRMSPVCSRKGRAS